MRFISLAMASIGYCGIAAFSGAALAQSAKDFIGTWTLVSVTLEEQGKTSEPFGPAPRGMAMFDGTHQSIIILRAEMPKFASNNRLKGTAEENMAAVQGSLAFFGPYTFDEAAKSLNTKVAGSNFPNWLGLEQKRTAVLSGDTLTLSNPTPSGSGPGGIAKIVWKRLK